MLRFALFFFFTVGAPQLGQAVHIYLRNDTGVDDYRYVSQQPPRTEVVHFPIVETLAGQTYPLYEYIFHRTSYLLPGDKMTLSHFRFRLTFLEKENLIWLRNNENFSTLKRVELPLLPSLAEFTSLPWHTLFVFSSSVEPPVFRSLNLLITADRRIERSELQPSLGGVRPISEVKDDKVAFTYSHSLLFPLSAKEKKNIFISFKGITEEIDTQGAKIFEPQCRFQMKSQRSHSPEEPAEDI